QEGVEALRVGAVGILADGDVELPVGPEVDGTAVVVGGRAEGIQIQQDDLAAGHGDVAVGGEPADAVVGRGAGHRVIEIDVVVDREGRVERHAEQPAFAGRVHIQGD